jgi:hypothetical protein
MTAQQPENRNFLTQTGFEFVIKNFPNVQYFVQSVNLPGYNIISLDQGTLFATMRLQGTKLHYNDLEVEFVVDEDLRNWEELHNWAVGITFPQRFEEYAAMKKIVDPDRLHYGINSDLVLIIQTSNKNANIEILFQEAFPVQVSDIKFSSNNNDIQYLTATATFRYIFYTINPLHR